MRLFRQELFILFYIVAWRVELGLGPSDGWSWIRSVSGVSLIVGDILLTVWSHEVTTWKMWRCGDVD